MFSKRELERLVAADIKGRKVIEPAEVIQLWEDIEAHRAAIACKLAIFENWLDVSEPLYADWCEFTELGGVTAHELRRFLYGQTIRARRVRARKHLRMVVNNRRRPMVLKTSPRNDDDAA